MMRNTGKIVVIGGGESGFGSAVLAAKMGFDTFLSDKSMLEPLYREQLQHYGIPFEEGGHTFERILQADEVIKSPGVPDKVEVVRKIKEAGIPIVSEIEFASRYNTAKTICITGSNGKTTTTTLIYELLKNAGFNIGLAGNIGKSFAFQVATEQFDWYAIELSSFQLDDTYDFRADIAILTNITPDHLDRYDYKMENYVNSKFRIARNQTLSQYFVYCADDPEIAKYLSAHRLSGAMIPYSVKQPLRYGGYLDAGSLRVSIDDKQFGIETAALPLKGLHNYANIEAAVIAALLAGADADTVGCTLREFAGVEHRLEFVGQYNGIEFINDSKATNVDSVWYALESMTRPVVWIAGGTDKGNDYAPLIDFARQKVHTLVCMGLDNEKLIRSFTGVVPNIVDTHSLQEAMNAVCSAAVSGDAVLLSPACASFDLFDNYEDRGRKFKAAVSDRMKNR